MTLTEVLVASAVAAIAVIGITAMEVSRARNQAELRRRSGVLTDVAQTGLAASIQLTRSVEAADRIRFLAAGDPTNMLLRTFDPDTDCAGLPNSCVAPPGGAPALCCYDVAANYRWDEYRRTGNELRYYRDIANVAAGGCANRTVLSREIGSFSVDFVDATPQAPPGGEPPIGAPGSDSNTLRYSLLWDNGLAGAQRLTHTFSGQITSRAIPYSNVNSGAGDSGSGMAPPGVSDPPIGLTCP